MSSDYVSIKIPSKLMQKVEKEINDSDGLYENPEDYVSHCLKFWFRNKHAGKR